MCPCCLEVLIRKVVVLRRDFVHYNYCVYKGQHRTFSTPDMYKNISENHHLDCDNSLYCLQHRLHFCDGLPMLPSILLLDEISWRVRQMHSDNCYCRHDLCAWGDFYMVGLDIGYPTNFLSLEFEHESSNKGLCGLNPRARCFVRASPLSHLAHRSLIECSGSAASIVRFPYIYQLNETQDFLWSNTDVSIWSTIEPGIGITASSLATMRPLFVAFFSRSRLFGSTTTPHGHTHPKNPSQLGYVRKRSNIDAEDLELHSDLGKSILVTTTTVTQTQSTLPARSEEAGTGSSESERALKGENTWGADSERSRSLEDVGYRTTIEAGAAV